jgi:hypothetical protein
MAYILKPLVGTETVMQKNIVISLLLLITMLNHGNGQTHEQTASLFQSSTSKNISLAFGSASTAGNLVIVHLDWDKQSRSVASVTDNKGNLYQKIIGPTNWNGTSYRAELWYAYNIRGGALTITAKLTGNTTSFFQIYISEYSGIVSSADPLDKSSVNTGNTAAVSSGAATVTYNNELIYGAAIGASGTLSKGSGFTLRSSVNQNIIEDKTGSSVGSYSTNFTSAGGNWVAQMASFISVNSLIVLPVRLLSFTGKCDHNKIALTWSAASEMNNDYFTIEQSAEGTEWKVAGTKKSAGNSAVAQQYSFTAEASAGEFSYFRLKQTDVDGKSTYSEILRVDNCRVNATAVDIYPNPSNGASLYGRINLKANEAYTIEVFDNLGKMVYRGGSVQPAFAVSFPHILPSGTYYARFYSANFSTVKSILVTH